MENAGRRHVGRPGEGSRRLRQNYRAVAGCSPATGGGDDAGAASTGESSREWQAPSSDIFFTSNNFAARKNGAKWNFRANVELEEGVAGRKIINTIEQAKTSIKIATAHFRRPPIAEKPG